MELAWNVQLELSMMVPLNFAEFLVRLTKFIMVWKNFANVQKILLKTPEFAQNVQEIANMIQKLDYAPANQDIALSVVNVFQDVELIKYY